MLAAGRARAIGVSNFSPEHLRRLVDRTDVVPAVNQEEVAAIDALDRGVRGGPDPELLSPETYPKVVDNS